MSLPDILKLLVRVALPLLLFAEGLSIQREELRQLARSPGLFARSFVAVVLLVPMAVIVIARLLDTPLNVTVALALLAASPIAPIVMGQVTRAGGDEPFGRSLHVLLAATSIVTVPLVLSAVSRGTGFNASIGTGAIARAVLLSVMLPILLGVLVERRRPRLARRLARPLHQLGMAVIAGVFLLILVSQFELLGGLGPRSYLAIILTILAGLLSGHLMIRDNPRRQTTLAVEAASRNPAIALLIAEVNFPEAKAAPVLIPYFVTFLLIMTIYGQLRRRRTAGLRREPLGG